MAGLMMQGTGSDVGKSVLVAGLCRAAANRGLKVLPFKPQNMSNNAAVTPEGGEIGRAQALQALAARAELHVDMNPVLLKPQADRTSQLIVRGQMRGTLGAANFREARRPLLPEVLESYRRLEARCDLVLIEGAGSPAEINLRSGDIANMGFAHAANVPVVLAGDIDRGGVIAAIVGTRAVIDPADAAMIRGFIINKFRGAPALFADGYAAVERLSGWRGYGVLPWVPAVAHLPSEDAVVLERRLGGSSGKCLIACPILPRIANFDDLDPLRQEPGVEVAMIPPGTPLPAQAALIVLPGSKATIADMAFLRQQGWDIDVLAHHRRGGMVLGICGGYQMLGRTIADPHGIEGPPGEMAGLGLLNVATVLGNRKALRQVEGQALGAAFTGYEMHMGITGGPDSERPFAELTAVRTGDERPDGAIAADGRVLGTYCHGLFARPGLRGALLERLDVRSTGFDQNHRVDAALDALAAAMEAHLDIDGLLALAGSSGVSTLFVLGGARSGKSRYAQARTEAHPGTLAYIATAQAFDDEMAMRIASHRGERGPRWITLEEPTELPAAIRRAGETANAILVDCLTLWTSNLMLAGSDMDEAAALLCEATRQCPCPVVLVANEVGLGIVPENPLARRFRDEAGRLNQTVAALADEVQFIAAGLPLRLK